jgi:excisionase family DNA binding protein
MTKKQRGPRTYTAREVAAKLGVSKSTVERRARAGQLPVHSETSIGRLFVADKIDALAAPAEVS